MTAAAMRLLVATDTPWATAFLDELVGGRMQARRGELIDALTSTGLVAEIQGRPAGLVAWRFEADGLEAEVTVLAVRDEARGQGVGRALIDAAVDVLRRAGVQRAWLVTTNDNLVALRLYQRAGWRLATVRPGAVDEARRSLKPGIPIAGDHGIPIRDELELTRELQHAENRGVSGRRAAACLAAGGDQPEISEPRAEDDEGG